MHVPDLTPLSLPGFEASSQLLGVGWLEPGLEFAVGDVDHDFANKLKELLVDPWQPMVAVGRHLCGFCQLTGGPSTFRLADSTNNSEVAVGVSNLWLPDDGVLYVAPSLILHYMDAHSYAPPKEFRAAVMNCPPMRSMEYLKAILRNGPKGIVSK